MKIRIGKDICLRWAILTNGEETALEGRDLKLYLSDYTRRRVEVPFESSGNTAIITLRASQLQRLGEYVMTLVENEGQDGQTIVDAKPAFTLVEYSTEEDDDAAPDLEVEQVTLETANLTKAGGGISPEDLFAGKPSVMQKGDIVPAMRNGELRPVRVPGTLNGKFRGVIHKAVPIHPRAGMAYVFRGNRLAFKTNSEIFVEHAQRLKDRFQPLIVDTFNPNVVYTNKGSDNSIYSSYEDVLPILDEVDVRLIFIDDSNLLSSEDNYDRTIVLYILSDGESTNSVNFRFSHYPPCSNRLEMASENYIVSGQSVLFTGLPLLKPGTNGKDFDILKIVKRSVRWNREGQTHRSVFRRGWRRILDGQEKSKFDKIVAHLNYRIVRYETKYMNRRSIHFMELRGSSIFVRIGMPPQEYDPL